jgi:hypothetical protein
MRFATLLIAVGITFSGTTARAQAVAVPNPSVPSGQPSFQIPSFGSTPTNGLPLRPAKWPSIRAIPDSAFESIRLLANTYTCPMPVVRTDTAKEDPMPVARGGTPVAMPVAKPGCFNPLDRVP